jgi:hypothetical protein
MIEAIRAIGEYAMQDPKAISGESIYKPACHQIKQPKKGI